MVGNIPISLYKIECFRLSDRGRTVVFSVHQPRYAIFEKFNCLFLMSNGKTVYHGLASESINFFKQAGMQL